MADGGDKKKRKTKYASFSFKRKRSTCVPLGRQGFLVTCDGGREHQCARECIYLLDEFYEKLSEENGAAETSKSDEGPEDGQHEGEVDKKDGDSTEKNIDEELEAEILKLRDKEKARFVNIETGCNGIVFIDMMKGAVGPVELGESVVRHVATTKKLKTRFSMKLLPIEVTCYASAEAVKNAAQPLISQHFPPAEANDPGLKFAVVYEARANTGLDRMTLINAVATLVPKPHTVDLKSPDRTIVVQVVKTTCAIGILKDFKELSKYNLKQLALPPETKDETNEETKDAEEQA